MAADELQAALDRAEHKRSELVAQQPAARESAKVVSLMLKAAELLPAKSSRESTVTREPRSRRVSGSSL